MARTRSDTFVPPPPMRWHRIGRVAAIAALAAMLVVAERRMARLVDDELAAILLLLIFSIFVTGMIAPAFSKRRS